MSVNSIFGLDRYCGSNLNFNGDMNVAVGPFVI